MSDQNDPMADIRASFFVECEELLEALQDGLGSLDDGVGDSETINVVFRAVHSIKGGAGAFGLEHLVRFAHRYETVLDEVRSNGLTPDHENVKLFFRAADHLSDLVRASRDGLTVPQDAGDALLAELDAMLGTPAETDEASAQVEFTPLGIGIDLGDLDAPFDAGSAPSTRWSIRFQPRAELYETGNEPQILLRNLARLGTADVTCDVGALPLLLELSPETPHLAWTIALDADVSEAEIREVFEFVDGLCDLEVSLALYDDNTASTAERPPAADVNAPAGVTLPQPDTAPQDMPAPPPARRAAEPPARSVVRVDLERIERLVNLVGELVINQAMLAQSLVSAGLSPHSDAMNGLEEFQRLTRDIQDSVMMIRAQPVKSLFQRMSRIVREASAAVGKEVRLVTDGEATEVDKTVIERLADPLTHMIRNAVDHGLEPGADRVSAGKSAEGTVRLSAAHRSGRVIIELSDDGGGINRPRVLQIARTKGLIPPEASLSDTEIDNLLFLPGFSTAESVSNLSGRGVGMDVVRTAIQQLGGRISIQSESGQGTTFTISLPLTLAVLDGMVVDVAGETMVLPLNVVVETLSLGPDDVQMLRPGAELVRVRGGFVPLYDLGAMLGYRSRRTDYTGCIVLLISLDDGNRAALVIDGIEDQRQVVIKGLDDSFFRAPGIAAATILGDGQIALILDPADVIAGCLVPLPVDARLPDRSSKEERLEHG
ncbi:chemotaxis protein CheA [Oceanicola sp. 22II-s10i]|uniref:chemotaxis protein CheA n=1 Tax=Oceanicola sp. 22II-s10i TaxID=1317116 RepID=UPI000B52866D|nr:chemotaxis protein CheA [Oceanicola sp. 22II-s10i]